MKLTVFTRDGRLCDVITSALEIYQGSRDGYTAVRCEPSVRPDEPNGDIYVADLDTCTEAEMDELLRPGETSVHPLVAVGRKKRTEYSCLKAIGGEKTVYLRRPLPLVDLCDAILRAAKISEHTSAEQEDNTTETDTVPPTSAHRTLTYSERSDVFLVDAEPLKLSPTEHALLLALYKKRGEPISRRELFKTVWNKDGDAQASNLTDVYVRYLRRKLDDRFGVKMIISVRNHGYMLR